METEAQAALRDSNDLEDFPGQHFIAGRSVEEDYRQMTLDPRQAVVRSAMDHGENFVDLAGPSEPPAPKEEEDDWSFDLSGDDDNGQRGQPRLQHLRRTSSLFLFFSSNSSHFCIKRV
jgi:hypothetical protein